MIPRSSFSRNVQVGLRKSWRSSQFQRRYFAAAASGSFAYETGDASGVKFASRDLPGSTTTLAVVSKAGTRYQPLPGITEGLERFAFKSTERRSTLRITREAELLGGELTSYHSRENLVIGAKFLKADLPYFVELLGEVISKTKYLQHEFTEEVIPSIQVAQKARLARTDELALDSAHSIAFHRGLGTPLHTSLSTPLSSYADPSFIGLFSETAYAKPNIAVVANGVDSAEFAKWIKEFFSDTHNAATKELDDSIPGIGTTQTKYYGGEERISNDSGNTMIIAFPGSSSFAGSSWKPEILVLAALLGGQSSVKWSPGFSLLSRATSSFPGAQVSTTNSSYSDAGLLYITLSGNAFSIKDAGHAVVETLKTVAAGEISSDDFKKAVAAAKFQTLESGQDISTGIELTGNGLIVGGKAYQIDEVGKSIGQVTETQLKNAAKALLEGKATVSAVGDLYALPYAEEIGLSV